MVRSMREMIGYRLDLTDGEMGAVEDFFFDDNQWTVRYLVAKTGPWLFGRKVLIVPDALGTADWVRHTLKVLHTKEEVKSSPEIDADRPVSRQHEVDLHQHYQWMPYWSAHGLAASPITTEELKQDQAKELGAVDTGDPHLRSAREVLKYNVHDSAGEKCGHVFDFIVSQDGWSITHVVVDLGAALHSQTVLIKARDVQAIEWENRRIRVPFTRDQLTRQPAYDPADPVNAELYVEQSDYKGRPRSKAKV